MSYLSYTFLGLSIVSATLYIYRNTIKSYIVQKIVDSIVKSCDKLDQEDTFKISPTGKSVTISFIYHNRKYNVFLPFDKSLISKYSGYQFYLETNDKITEISQKPGIPFLVTADQLGGTSIIVQNVEDDICMKFNENQIPSI